jgi:hypothetical protein
MRYGSPRAAGLVFVLGVAAAGFQAPLAQEAKAVGVSASVASSASTAPQKRPKAS